MRQIDDEVVNDAPVRLLLNDLNSIDIGVDASHRRRNRAQRTWAVRQSDPHQEHVTIFTYLDYFRVSGL